MHGGVSGNRGSVQEFRDRPKVLFYLPRNRRPGTPPPGSRSGCSLLAAIVHNDHDMRSTPPERLSLIFHPLVTSVEDIHLVLPDDDGRWTSSIGCEEQQVTRNDVFPSSWKLTLLASFAAQILRESAP